MRKIDIKTTQNVTIEYELASVIERSIAFLIDFIIIYLGSWLIYGIIKLMISEGIELQYGYVVAAVSFLYYLLMESLNHGQTAGKAVLKIRVVKINGERPGFFDFFMRTVFRIIDITASLGSIALLLVSSMEKGQRLGDFFADTTVVKLINMNRFSLDRILSMEKLKTYQPVYPNVIKFKEEEMLLIKETLDRATKYPNESHKAAFNELIKKIEEQLDVTAPKNKVTFINTLIKDYVSLTR